MFQSAKGRRGHISPRGKRLKKRYLLGSEPLGGLMIDSAMNRVVNQAAIFWLAARMA
jgi:hypothetical protein